MIKTAIKTTLVFTFFMCFSTEVIAQQSPKRDSIKAFNYIKFGASHGLFPYGFNSESGINLKNFEHTNSLSPVFSLDINIYDRHGIYGEYFSQPMLHGQADIEGFFSTSPTYYYDLYIRARGFNIGYIYRVPIRKNIDLNAKIGFGKTYFEYQEYLTNKNTLAIQKHYFTDTLTNFSLGVQVEYRLPNNIGISTEVAVGRYSPLIKFGLTYYIKSR